MSRLPGEALRVSIAAGRNGAEIARSDLDLSPLEDEEAAEDDSLMGRFIARDGDQVLDVVDRVRRRLPGLIARTAR